LSNFKLVRALEESALLELVNEYKSKICIEGLSKAQIETACKKKKILDSYGRVRPTIDDQFSDCRAKLPKLSENGKTAMNPSWSKIYEGASISQSDGVASKLILNTDKQELKG